MAALALRSLLGPLALLFCGTLLCGFAALLAVREAERCITRHATRRRVVSLTNCLGDGMFLAICFLDLVPQYLAEMKEGFRNLQITLQFPLPEFIMAMGFFLILATEQIVLAYMAKSKFSQVDRQTFVMNSSIISHGQNEQSPRGLQHSVELIIKGHHGRQESPGMGHCFLSFRSAIHCFILALALSLHSVLEGLMVGLQSNGQKMWNRSAMLIFSKGVVAFALVLQFSRCHLRPVAIAGGLFTFAMTSPLGIGLGSTLEASASGIKQHLACSTLQGLTVGCFIYITFMEILPHELGSSKNHMSKITLLLTGFAVVTGLLFIKNFMVLL
ncbi:zinc transporter ZIP1-like [Scleropages formosus]|uniref:Solute carrier family 39 member 1 n=1 Tax=Scleropages formosus TaxID=113540 RepID=A0A8C9SL99_SCLFO|nr:zinc transporter ZIP1-like [Scleropages formosus]